MAGSFGFNRINWNAMALCILAASVFWLFSALNEDHTSTLDFPLDIRVDQSSFIPVAKNPQFVSVQVEGKGWELLARQLTWRQDPISLEIENPVVQPYIVTKTLEKRVRASIGDLRMIQFISDTLLLQFEDKKSRTVSVVADLSDVQFKKGYDILDSVKMTPSKISITGPASEVIEIGDTIVVKISQRRFSGKFEQSVRAPLPALTQSEPKMILVSFDAVRVKEISMMLPIRNSRAFRLRSSDSIRVRLMLPEEMKEKSLSGLSAEVSKTAPGIFVSSINGLPASVRIIQSDTK